MRVVLIGDRDTDLVAAALVHRLTDLEHAVPLAIQLAPGAAPARRSWRAWRRRWVEPRVPGAANPRESSLSADLCLRGYQGATLRAACEAAEAKFAPVPRLESDSTLLEIRAQSPDVIVSLSANPSLTLLAELAPHGVLRVDPAPRVEFLGPNALQWTLLYGQPPSVSIRALSSWSNGEGESPLVVARRSVLRDHSTLSGLADLLRHEMVDCTVDTIQRLAAEGELSGEPAPAQQAALGPMADPLLEVVELRHRLRRAK